MFLAVGLCFVLRPLWAWWSLSPRTVAYRAGLTVLVVIPLKAKGDIFPASAFPTVGSTVLQLVLAYRAGKHGVTSVFMVPQFGGQTI